MIRRGRSGQDTVKRTIYVLDSVDKELNKLFEDNSFFKSRAEYLNLFQQLAITLHQTNNLRYLLPGALATDMFSDELNTSNLKIMEVRAQIIENIVSKMEEMISFRDTLQSNDNQLIAILNSLSSKTASTIQLRVFIKNDDHRKQSLIFTMEDTRSKIIIPSLKVITEEISAGNKVLDSLKFVLSHNDDTSYTIDELARICEMIALGMDPPTLWEDVKLSLKQNELRREVVSLRPHGILEETELDSFFS